MTNLFIVTLLVVIPANLLLGVGVLLTNWRRSANRVFALLSLVFTLWLSCQYLGATATNEVWLSFWIRQTCAVSVLIPLIFYMLRDAVEHPKTTINQLMWCAWRWVLVAGCTALLCQTRFFLVGARLPTQTEAIAEPLYGYGFLLFVAYWVIFVGALVWRFFRSLKQAEGGRRMELKIMFCGSLFGVVPGVLIVLIVPLLTGSSQSSRFAPIAVVIWHSVIAYGIATRHIMGIGEFLGRVITGTLLAIFLAALYAGVFFAVTFLVYDPSDVVRTVAHVVAAVAVALALAPADAFLRHGTARLFDEGHDELPRLLDRGGELTRSITTVDKLLHDFCRLLRESLGLSHVCAYLRCGEHFEPHTCLGAVEDAGAVGRDDPLLHALQTERFPLLRDVLRRAGLTPLQARAERALARLNAEAAVALQSKNGMAGFLLLGRRAKGRIFGRREEEALKFLGDQMGIALENATLYTQIRRSDRLASIGTLAAGMAHEIKNPLVCLKTFAQLLPDRYDDPDFRSTFIPLLGTEVERINTIVSELLNFSRPVKPQLVPLSLHDVLDAACQLAEQPIKAKGLTLERRYHSENDRLLGEHRLLGQVFLNLFLNGIDAMERGGTLSVSTLTVGAPGLLPYPDPAMPEGAAAWIEVRVSDTGHGIPLEERQRIFDPFFTTKANGTGLGLSVAHGIVLEHRGVIDLASTSDAGTCFRVLLPLIDEASDGPPDQETKGAS
jgi:signal transduction histidine kinase